jgi:DNA-binding transcriptional MerR regulator
MLRIGEFARLSGLSSKALRNYDLRGVFHPAWVDPATGYRYYSPTQLPGLRRIVALKELGLPLAEVAALVSGGGDVRAALDRRRSQLEAMRADLARTLEALDIRIEWEDTGPDVVVRTVAAQRVAGLRAQVPTGADIGPLFHELEALVARAGARANLPPGAVVFDRGRTTIDVEVFVPVSTAVDRGRVATRVLDSARVAALIHHGSYEAMDRTREALDRWVEASRWERAGPARVIYLSFGAEPDLGLPSTYLADRAVDFVTELQLPVRDRGTPARARPREAVRRAR